MTCRTARFAVALGTLALTLACGGSSYSMPYIPPQTTGRTVTGTVVATYHGDGTATPAPQDMSTTTFLAFVPDGKGSFTTSSAYGTANGTFSIPNVPTGDCWVGTQGTFVWGPATAALDFGYDLLGRTTATYAGGSGNTLGFTLTGMTPWATGDDLQWVASNLGGVVLDSISTPPATGAPAVGATGLTATEFGWNDVLMADTTKGDQPFLLHLSAGTGGIVSSVTDVFPVPTLTQVDGGTPVLTGAFATGLPTLPCTPAWQGSAYAALATQVNPAATFGQGTLYYFAAPEGTSHGLLGSTPRLLTCTFSTTDQTLPDQAPLNPFPATYWTPVALGYTQYDVSVKPPGATTGATATAEVYAMSTTLPTAAAPCAPVLAPPSAPLINGNNLFTYQTGVGLVPTLSWSAPSFGTPTAYAVTVNIASVNGSGATVLSQGEAIFYTTGTSIQLPPGLLSTGSYYYFSIAALACPGLDLTASPYRSQVPFATASLVTSIVTP